MSSNVRFQYRMVQVPPTIAVAGRQKGDEAAAYLQDLANKAALDGWEFFRVDAFGVQVPSGCLGLGPPQTHQYYVVTFRRMADEPARGIHPTA